MEKESISAEVSKRESSPDQSIVYNLRKTLKLK